MTEVTQEKLNAFVGKMLGDLGGAFSVPTTRIGLRLGLFDALYRHGPATSKELAARTSN
ncbi:MAG: SAM-dependent methyltransferase, partial [Hyphomicrobiaceae bacterium]